MKHYTTSLILAAIVLVLAAQKGNGIVLILLAPCFLIYLIFHAVRMIRKPEERKSRGIRLAIWAAALILAGVVQAYWSAASRSDADLALQSVQTFKERAGTYPASLREVGLDDQALQEKWGIRYSVREGQPTLVYPAPIMPLSMVEYDFAGRRWRINSY